MNKVSGWLMLLASCLLWLVPIAGCVEQGEGFTTKASVVQPTGDIEFGIYPAKYEIRGYDKGGTVDLPFTLYNDLLYSTVAEVYVVLPTEQQLAKNPGYKLWPDIQLYCSIVEADLVIPADGSKVITLRLHIPADIEMPSKFFFYVAYRSEGQKWGSYGVTLRNNFVFYPYCFQPAVTDETQSFTWLTWGNNPEVMVRSSYDKPPESITEGLLVYQGMGEQVIRKWEDPETGKVLDRQYTLYSITDNQTLSFSGGEKLFYRAWQKHLVKGEWDGTWDVIGQSMIVAGVNAKVVVTK